MRQSAAILSTPAASPRRICEPTFAEERGASGQTKRMPPGSRYAARAAAALVLAASGPAFTF